MPTWAVIFIVGLAVMGLFRRMMRLLADGTVEQAINEFQPRHDYQPLDPQTIRGMDPAFHDTTRDWLAALGFTTLADLEDRTLMGGPLDVRMWIRVMLSPDRTLAVFIMRVRFRQPYQGLMTLSVPHTTAMSFEVESTDGRFYHMEYSAVGAAEEAPPGVYMQGLKGTLSPEAIYKAFYEDYAKFRTEHPDFLPREIPDYASWEAMQQRLHAIRAAHRRQLGVMRTRGELIRAGMKPEFAESMERTNAKAQERYKRKHPDVIFPWESN